MSSRSIHIHEHSLISAAAAVHLFQIEMLHEGDMGHQADVINAYWSINGQPVLSIKLWTCVTGYKLSYHFITLPKSKAMQYNSSVINALVQFGLSVAHDRCGDEWVRRTDQTRCKICFELNNSSSLLANLWNHQLPWLYSRLFFGVISCGCKQEMINYELNKSNQIWLIKVIITNYRFALDAFCRWTLEEELPPPIKPLRKMKTEEVSTDPSSMMVIRLKINIQYEQNMNMQSNSHRERERNVRTGSDSWSTKIQIQNIWHGGTNSQGKERGQQHREPEWK